MSSGFDNTDAPRRPRWTLGRRSPRPAGPGLPEACAWTFGYLLVQAIAAGMGIGVLLLAAYGGFPPDTQAALDLLLQINLDTSFLLTGVTTLGALALIAPAVRLRLGAAYRKHLQLRRASPRDVLLAAGALAPLAVLSNVLYRLALEQWSQWVAHVPQLAKLSETNTLEVIGQQAHAEPFAILAVALAVGPAIGEEVVFRGLIGQGLVRRWGPVAGVLLTSVLFAGVHGFPPHALATLPLAVFLHFAYLQTRSLWTPIILHGLNNALSVAMLKYPIVQKFPASPGVLFSAGLYLLVIVVLLRSPRTGMLPRPGSAVAGSRLGAALAGACIVGFTTSFVWAVLAMPRA